MQLHHIVVVLEPFQEQQPALERAVDLARRARARLELQCVVARASSSGETAIGSIETSTAHPRNLASWMEAVRTDLLAQGLDVTTVASYGRPYYERVLEHVQEKPPDVLVKGTRFHAALSRNYFAASDWRLIARCPVPLLLVKHAQAARSGPVIAAIDPFHDDDKPAELDRRILDVSAEVARLFKSELLVVHAVSPVAPLPVAGELYLGQIRAETERMNRHLEAVRDVVRPYGVQPRSLQVVAGTPEDVIAGTAVEQEASLVVMGAVSRSSIKELFIGNTAERVLEVIANDLLVVPMRPNEAS